MINLGVREINSILCLGAHADDIEIGCGGAVLKLLAEHPLAKVTWVVLSADEVRVREAERCAREFLAGAAESEVIVKRFRDAFFPYEGKAIKQYFQELQRSASPDVIFTHRREDLHQDHRVVAELTWNTFRDHLIVEYEIPKYEGDLGAPNVFFTLDKATCQRKIDTLYGAFQSQRAKPWFTPETFWAVLRLRGIESASPSGYAEGHYCRKLVF